MAVKIAPVWGTICTGDLCVTNTSTDDHEAKRLGKEKKRGDAH
jgi:hypothetical protein